MVRRLRDTTKLVFFIKRRQGIERAHLDDYWLKVHVPNVVAAINNTPDAVRYSVDLVDLDDSERERTYDGWRKSVSIIPTPHSPTSRAMSRTVLANWSNPMLVCSGYEVRIVD